MRTTLALTWLASLLVLPVLAQEKEDKKELKPTLKVVWTVDKDLVKPESAYVEPESGSIYVSNIGDGDAKKDGNGYISKLDAKGKMIEAKWATGLNDPKGIRSAKGTLWVSDVDEVVGFSLKDGEESERIKVEGAQFLNDVAAGADGTIYVTDLLASKVYAIKDGKFSVFAEGDQLEGANGLLVDGNRILLGGWGTPPGFNPTTPGHLLSLDMKTKKVTKITKEPTANLDGVELDGKGGYTCTDWKSGKVFHITKDGKVTVIMQSDPSTADHAYLPKQNLLILPHMMQNKLVAYEFKAP
jgi:DNA-binding beta-propeller fold protein YncE